MELLHDILYGAFGCFIFILISILLFWLVSYIVNDSKLSKSLKGKKIAFPLFLIIVGILAGIVWFLL
ncbi:MAG: hypothetical protein IJL87_03805 [Clostridia bacterium]|nr:hypothetical protein [Clostridia bacterium]